MVPDTQEFTWRIEHVSARYPWLIAETDDGVVAGYAYATPHRERAAYRWAADVAIYVDPQHRSQGIGKELYGMLLELLARQGVRTVCGGVTLPNPASVALHEACGFELVGIYRRIGYKQGDWHDVGWWQLELEPDADGPPNELGPPAQLDDG